MKVNSKFLSGLIILLLIAVMLVSCGGAARGANSITVMVFDRGTDGGKTNPTDNEWTEWIKKKVLEDEGITVTFIPIPRFEDTQTLNSMMAAGSAPDVCYTYAVEMASHFGELGGLIDLAPYVDTLLKDYNNFMGMDPRNPSERLIYSNRDPESRKVFMIPGRYLYTASQNLFIRKDWLDKLGLPLPTTTQQYFDALVAFKDRDPGGVGRDNVVPFVMTVDARWSAGTIVDPFIDPNLSFKDRWINTIVERYLLMPGYKEGYRFLNRMYNRGLIDVNFPLYKADEIDIVIKSGRVGSLAGNWDHIYRENTKVLEDLKKNVPGADLVPINAIQDANGKYRKRGSPPTGLFWFIPRSAKYPEAAIRYVNWLSKFENYNFLQFGNEGINHEIVDGIPSVKTVQGPWIQNSAGNMDYAFLLNGYDVGDPDLNIRVLANSYNWPAEIITNAYDISSTDAIPDPHLWVKLVASTAYQQVLHDKAQVVFSQSITARPNDFDRVWDAGVRDWLSSGAQTILDERKAQYRDPSGN